METPLEVRVEELLHRLRIEAAVVAGAKNYIRISQNNKVPDKKALQEVSVHKKTETQTKNMCECHSIFTSHIYTNDSGGIVQFFQK